MGASKPITGKYPVIFGPRVARSIAGHIASAINGSAIARKTSFLKDMMNKKITNSTINVIDDPFLKRGLGSKLFDGEGLGCSKHLMIKDGILQAWLLDLASAKQLNMQPTGNARRGISGPASPSTSNFMIMPGEVSPESLIADVSDGFYITDMIGSSVSIVTGDYSRGASGFWIKNGKLSIIATDLDIIFYDEISEIEVEKDGATTTSATILYDILRKISGNSDIKFDLKDMLRAAILDAKDSLYIKVHTD
jgi:PmbA protein